MPALGSTRKMPPRPSASPHSAPRARPALVPFRRLPRTPAIEKTSFTSLPELEGDIADGTQRFGRCRVASTRVGMTKFGLSIFAAYFAM